MLHTVSKTFFHVLAGSLLLKSAASRYGMRGRGGFARRFIAGETVDEALAAAKEIQASGLNITLVTRSVCPLRAATVMIGNVSKRA